jgi:hypothetical protein
MSDPTTNATTDDAGNATQQEATVIVENEDGTLSDVPVSQLDPSAKPKESETDDLDEEAPEDGAITADYWKSRSRKNETAKNKALNENKALQAELSTVKTELAAIKHEANLNSIMNEYGLADSLKVLLTAADPEALKVQAAALAAATGGKVPTPAPVATPVPAPVVVAEQPKFINPLQAAPAQEVITPKSFGELVLEITAKH